LVATNLHVLKRAARGYIKLVGKSASYQIEKVVGVDMQHDLCALRVGASAPALPLALNHEGMARAGDEVYVAGNPSGLEGSFSRGIVSAVRPEVGLIQVDASISRGSSGGPVVNTRGQVVAVATSSAVNGQNLNFAVAASDLESLLKWRMPVDVAAALAVNDRENEVEWGGEERQNDGLGRLCCIQSL
jgi:S1-C subfamily serine protease